MVFLISDNQSKSHLNLNSKEVNSTVFLFVILLKICDHSSFLTKMSSRKHPKSCYSSKLYSQIGLKMYLSDETADFHFIFESGAAEVEVVPAHRQVLAAASDVFLAKFRGPWKKETQFKMTNVSCAAFKEFLRFFYFGKVTVSMEHVAELFNLAEEFGIVECSEVCYKFLENN